MSKPIAIIHFQSLEQYPPVMNLIDYLANYYSKIRVEVITTYNMLEGISQFDSCSGKINVNRFGKFGKDKGSIERALNYMHFYLATLIKLILIRPKKILYFETLSSYPVYIYTKIFNRKAEVLIHYHEYTSPDEYTSGMKLVRYFHKKESCLFKHAVWISHTNSERMNMFIRDEGLKGMEEKFKILPNYPPRSWFHTPDRIFRKPLKLVYVGALSLDTMYGKELFNWVEGNNGNITLDIFSHNIADDAMQYLKHLDSAFIHYDNKGINYFLLPNILKKYQVGVILYNGHIPNYKYNAPNKLFEYLACGLDVWFSKDIIGCYPYITDATYPKVCKVDFNKLNEIDCAVISGDRGELMLTEYFCESVFPNICDKLTNNI